MTYDEKDRALCEAHCNSAADEYFNARPQLDSSANRRIFYAGHRKAWIERCEAVRLNATVPDGWVLIATDAYEAGFGKGLQAAQTGKEIENPWGDEPGREAWSIGYTLAKERAPAAPRSAGNHRPDRQWYERMIQETLDDDFEIGPAFDEKAVPDGDAAEAVHDTNAVLASRYFELLKVVEAYEKHGVTCQTFRHFVDTPCAECNCAPAAPRPRDDGMPASSDERHLRRLLASRVAMPNTYFDDGEAHGAEHGIQIDFMREPVAEIDAKLRALNVARLAVAASQPLADEKAVPNVASEFNRAIDFAVEQGSEAASFLRSWREGDVSEWPEFAQLLSAAPQPVALHEKVDLVPRGLRWEETVAMMKDACAQAGVEWREGDATPTSIAINVMQRLANSAHKAGFRLALERVAQVQGAAPAAPQPVGAVPEVYALVHVDMLKQWGVYDQVKLYCVYPVSDRVGGIDP